MTDSKAGSLADWLDLPKDETGERAEGPLIEEEEEGSDFVHEILVMLLGRIIAEWVFPRGGAVAGSDTKLTLSKDHGRGPDLIVYLPGSPLPPRRGPIAVAPDIAVEIISPSPRDARRDRAAKVAEYAAFGIRYYWIVDPELRSLAIHVLGPDGRHARAVGATSGTVDRVPGCEGLTIDLSTLWETVDRLAPEPAPQQKQ